VEFNGLHILVGKCFGELFTARRRSAFYGSGQLCAGQKALTTALDPASWVILFVFDNFEASKLVGHCGSTHDLTGNAFKNYLIYHF